MREQIFAVLTALYDMWGDSHVERDLFLLRTIVKYMLYRVIRLISSMSSIRLLVPFSLDKIVKP